MSLPKPSPLASAGLNFVPSSHNDTYPLISPLQSSLPSSFKVFITGASKGIGRATALAYAKAGASAIGLGARSNLSDLEQEIVSVAKDAGRNHVPKVLSVNLDVQDQDSVENAAREVQRRWGSVDVLVNNAGYLANFKPMAESDPGEWWKTWEVNIKGPYLMTRAFMPLLLASSGKTILNITSRGAFATSPGASAYQTSKFALLRLTEFTNVDYGRQGILAYSLHPGGVATDLGRGMPKEMQDLIFKDQPELASDTIVYLTQSRQEWLAGRFVDVHWDMGEFFAMKDKIVQKDLLKVRLLEE